MPELSKDEIDDLEARCNELEDIGGMMLYTREARALLTAARERDTLKEQIKSARRDALLEIAEWCEANAFDPTEDPHAWDEGDQVHHEAMKDAAAECRRRAELATPSPNRQERTA